MTSATHATRARPQPLVTGRSQGADRFPPPLTPAIIRPRCESGRVNDYMLERYVRKYLVRGRERFGYLTRRQDMVQDIVRELMPRMDVDSDGIVSMDDFLEWSRVHDLEGFVEDHASRAWDTARNCMDTM